MAENLGGGLRIREGNNTSLLEIGAILGHKQAQTTARYSHLTEQASHTRALLTAEELLGDG